MVLQTVGQLPGQAPRPAFAPGPRNSAVFLPSSTPSRIVPTQRARSVHAASSAQHLLVKSIIPICDSVAELSTYTRSGESVRALFHFAKIPLLFQLLYLPSCGSTVVDSVARYAASFVAGIDALANLAFAVEVDP